MKFLVDQQLPPGLAVFLCTRGHDSQHVRDLGLRDGSDRSIWAHALSHGMVVISKDEDFVFLANQVNTKGRLLWLRIGNCRKPALFAAFDKQLNNVLKEFEGGARIVELR